MTTQAIQANSVTSTPSISLRDKAQLNWQNCKSVVVLSGLSTSALAGGSIAAGLLGGPIGLIAGLAAAALISLALFLRSLFSQPTAIPADSQPQSAPKQPETSAAVAIPQPTVETHVVAPVADSTLQNISTQPAKPTLAGRVKNVLTSTAAFAKAHPYKIAGAALLMAGTGYAGYRMMMAGATPAAAPLERLMLPMPNPTCPVLPTSFAASMPVVELPTCPVNVTNATLVEAAQNLTRPIPAPVCFANETRNGFSLIPAETPAAAKSMWTSLTESVTGLFSGVFGWFTTSSNATHASAAHAPAPMIMALPAIRNATPALVGNLSQPTILASTISAKQIRNYTNPSSIKNPFASPAIVTLLQPTCPANSTVVRHVGNPICPDITLDQIGEQLGKWSEEFAVRLARLTKSH